MSSDSAPAQFPNRPIRPLPKRRLRERLSPEAAESIEYPPVPKTKLFSSYNYPSIDESVASGSGTGSALPREVDSDLERQSRKMGHGTEPDKEGGSKSKANTSGRPTLDTSGRITSPKSAADQEEYPSSPDGYESLENANNKKKRKIPTAQDGGGLHLVNNSVLGNGMLNRAAQSTDAHGKSTLSSSVKYNQHYGSAGHNVAGPGRGRFGRTKSGRSPLRPIFDPANHNSWTGRNGKLRTVPVTTEPSEKPGIISAAIANAEKLAPQQGQENISLLHQQLAAKRSEASNQFTFTCDSQVPARWPTPEPPRMAFPPPQQPSALRQAKETWSRSSQATQGDESMASVHQAAQFGVKEQSPKAGSSNHAEPPPPPPRKASRRSRLSRSLMAAAKARRRERQLYNTQHPPKPEDEIWICNFCEYEDIFGHPPRALIRSYELKDRKQRRLEQQRRAQWERMKKGKNKGKRNSKMSDKNHGHDLGRHRAAVDHYEPEPQDGEFAEDEFADDICDHHNGLCEHICEHVCEHISEDYHHDHGCSGGSSSFHDGGGDT
ncbi:hypothetical protein QBC38DRAFT_445864 [Podospora fimiseda]|uniref:Uncharacterized protein n=1 Tax=Podospora fimiseda TaxID=252190 RepID=A0AAN7BKN3_9PEZI|nr:hypothetical protein QBC38DRAFT_445864 [Podospora fimiseda]